MHKRLNIKKDKKKRIRESSRMVIAPARLYPRQSKTIDIQVKKKPPPPILKKKH
jgi:hypothetical protein